MKRNLSNSSIKYPLPGRAKFGRNLSRNRKAFARCQIRKFNYCAVAITLLGMLFSCVGVFSSLKAVFLTDSIQGAFNASLFFLTGLILIFVVTHDRFVERRTLQKQAAQQ